MRWLPATISLFMFTVPVPDPSSDQAPPDALKELQGEWVLEDSYLDGQGFTPAERAVMRKIGTEVYTFRGRTLKMQHFWNDGHVDPPRDVSFTIDPSRTPKHFDWHATRPKKTYPGLYEIAGDRLTIITGPKERRPEAFLPERGTVLLILKRKPK